MSERRPNPCSRGYANARWRRIRAAQLEREPWCETCREQGRWTLGNVADHKVAKRHFPLHLRHSEEPGGADHPSNLTTSCHHTEWNCHSRKREDKGRGKGRA